ncbi:hypothetical protein TIFTF001_042859 [Ficus carica]|uniref:Uncharacterized protein n=1 Tax=Ficus carica TaxID=3494 RepID=A0AA88CH49_FICCA|nr:hypothetical protein TIFTF001_042859 [Ficus carica]
MVTTADLGGSGGGGKGSNLQPCFAIRHHRSSFSTTGVVAVAVSIS